MNVISVFLLFAFFIIETCTLNVTLSWCKQVDFIMCGGNAATSSSCPGNIPETCSGQSYQLENSTTMLGKDNKINVTVSTLSYYNGGCIFVNGVILQGVIFVAYDTNTYCPVQTSTTCVVRYQCGYYVCSPDQPSACMPSYCLTGLSMNDYATFIASYYTYKGIHNDKNYYVNAKLPTNFTSYIYWHQTYSTWFIGPNISIANFWAYCTQPILENCNGQWYYYNGTSTILKTSLSINQCYYDNSDDCNIEYYQFCIANISTSWVNTVLGTTYDYAGCYENQPYYINSYTNIAIKRDNELNVWFISDNKYDTAYYSYAYCMENNLNDCSNNWYIYNGTTESFDPNAISGDCSIYINDTTIKQPRFLLQQEFRQEFSKLIDIKKEKMKTNN